MMRNSASFIWALFIAGLCSIALWPRCGWALESQLFGSDDIIDVRLTGPISQVFVDTEDRNYQSFTLETGDVEEPIEVRVRGHSRVRVCDFPPIKLASKPAEIIENYCYWLN